RGHAEHARRLAAVGAIVGDDAELLRLDLSVARKAHPDRDAHRHARAATGQELLLTRVDQLDRPTGGAGEDCAHQGVVVVAAFAPKTPADVWLDDAHVALAQPERPGDAAAGHEQRLGVHPQRQLAARTELGDAADRLD